MSHYNQTKTKQSSNTEGIFKGKEYWRVEKVWTEMKIWWEVRISI